MKKFRRPAVTGQQLLANFQTVFVSQATIQAAHYEAERSEGELMQYLQNASGGSYLQPSSLSDQQDSVTRASLDAHIKKVQADQLDTMSAYQLQQMQQQTEADFIGRKVHISVRVPVNRTVETIWYDEHNGYRSTVSKKMQYSGTIEELSLSKNLLLIQPTATSRMLNSSLQNYAVYVIDPTSSQPMIDVTIS